MASISGAEDGRRLRSERSRTAVIDALLSLYEQGVIRPTTTEIAERSGVSERSLFRHFTDLEDLAATAIARQFAMVAPLFEPPSADGSLAERVDAIVTQRLALAARMHHLARAAAYHAVSSPTIAAAVAERRRMLRRQVAAQFAPELRQTRGRTRAVLTALLDHALSLEGIDYLGDPTAGGLHGVRLRAAVRGAVSAALHDALGPTTAPEQISAVESPDPRSPHR